jgi:hypothetical protein
MGKIIRPTYPVEFSVGLLLLIFALSSFLGSQLFEAPFGELKEDTSGYIGMALVGLAVVIMVLILWEEFLFPITVVPTEGQVVFRNHRNKLLTQLFIYFSIPAIFVFIYANYEVNQVRFFIWAAICVIAPVAGKLISGINNYNDFLKLTNEEIAYKNNRKEGVFKIAEVQHITPVKDERNVLHKIQVQLTNNNQVIIDLDEMELADFYNSIDEALKAHYETILKEAKISA